jgi:hypothetical protein
VRGRNELQFQPASPDAQRAAAVAPRVGIIRSVRQETRIEQEWRPIGTTLSRRAEAMLLDVLIVAPDVLFTRQLLKSSRHQGRLPQILLRDSYAAVTTISLRAAVTASSSVAMASVTQLVASRECRPHGRRGRRNDEPSAGRYNRATGATGDDALLLVFAEASSTAIAADRDRGSIRDRLTHTLVIAPAVTWEQPT